MRIDLKQEYLKDHEIKIKRRFLFFPQRCIKCKMDYVREMMYEAIQRDRIDYVLPYRFNSVFGCTHCFGTKDELKRYVEDNNYLYSQEVLSNIWDKCIDL